MFQNYISEVGMTDVLFCCVPRTRAGIRLHGLYHLSVQVGEVHHADAIQLAGVRHKREHSGPCAIV